MLGWLKEQAAIKFQDSKERLYVHSSCFLYQSLFHQEGTSWECYNYIHHTKVLDVLEGHCITCFHGFNADCTDTETDPTFGEFRYRASNSSLEKTQKQKPNAEQKYPEMYFCKENYQSSK